MREIHIPSARATLLAGAFVFAGIGGASAQGGAPPAAASEAPSLPEPPGTSGAPSDATTPARGYAIVDGRIRSMGERTNDLDVGCRARELRLEGPRLYVACEDRRIVLLDTSTRVAPRIVGEIALEADFVSFFERDGGTWVELGDGRALALERATVRLAAMSSPAGASVSGSAQAIEGRSVIVDLGSAQGITPGSRIEFVEEVEESLAGGPVERQTRRIAVGDVVAVTTNRASVELGVNEQVPIGARARPTASGRTASWVAPARIGGVFQLAIEARPYLTVGNLGVGILVDASATYRGEKPWFVRASMDPSGAVLLRDESNGRQAQGSLVGGLDTRFLELGLGVGALRYQQESYSCSGTTCSDGALTQPAFGLAIGARLGALDGLHFRATTLLALRDQRWEFGSVDVAFQIPVARGTWLVLRGGTGTEAVGYSYATFAARHLAVGSGGARSLFLTGGMGWVQGGYRESPPSSPYIDFAQGIAFTLGAEYRL